MVPDKDERPNSDAFTLQGYGGMPKQNQGFKVKDREDSPRPTSNDSWNPKMGNPVGPK